MRNYKARYWRFNDTSNDGQRPTIVIVWLRELLCSTGCDHPCEVALRNHVKKHFGVPFSHLDTLAQKYRLLDIWTIPGVCQVETSQVGCC